MRITFLDASTLCKKNKNMPFVYDSLTRCANDFVFMLDSATCTDDDGVTTTTTTAETTTTAQRRDDDNDDNNDNEENDDNDDNDDNESATT